MQWAAVSAASAVEAERAVQCTAVQRGQLLRLEREGRVFFFFFFFFAVLVWRGSVGRTPYWLIPGTVRAGGGCCFASAAVGAPLTPSVSVVYSVYCSASRKGHQANNKTEQLCDEMGQQTPLPLPPLRVQPSWTRTHFFPPFFWSVPRIWLGFLCKSAAKDEKDGGRKRRSSLGTFDDTMPGECY